MDLDALLREMEQAEGAHEPHDDSTAPRAAAAAADWDRRLQRAKERDKQIKSGAQNQASTTAGAPSASSSSKFTAEKHLFSLRKQLQRDYAALIEDDLIRAVACDVEHALWKSCIYKPIEALRKLLRVATPNATAKRYAEQLTRYAKLYQFCARFLADACSYFERAFFARLPQSGWEAVRDSDTAAAASPIPHLLQMQLRPAPASAAAASSSAALRDASLHSCHRCLLFRGDLERYTQLMLHEPAALKWIAAAKQELAAQPTPPPAQAWIRVALFYRHAITLQPGVGGPWNQLAVLSTYEDQSLAAVSHYIRALTCTEPFATAKINLQLLLEKQRDVPLLLRHSQQHAGLVQTQSSMFPQHPVCGFFAEADFDRLWLILYELLFAPSSPHPHLTALPCVATAVISQFTAWIGRADGKSKVPACVRSIINLIFLCQHSAPALSAPPPAVHQTAVGLLFELLSAILSSLRSVQDDCVGVVIVFVRWLQLHPAFLHESLVPFPVRQTFWRQLAQLVNLTATHLASPTALDGEALVDENALLLEQQEILGCALFEPAPPVASSSGSPDASLLLGQQGSQSSADIVAAAAAEADDAPMSSGPQSATHRRCTQLMRLATLFVTQRLGLGKQKGMFHSLLDSPPVAMVDPPSSLPALEPASSPARVRSSAAPHAAAAAAALALACSPSSRAVLPTPIGAALSSPERHDPTPAADASSPPTDLMQDVEPPQPAETMAAAASSPAPAPAAAVLLPPSTRCPALSSIALAAGSAFASSYARLHFPQFAAAMVE